MPHLHHVHGGIRVCRHCSNWTHDAGTITAIFGQAYLATRMPLLDIHTARMHLLQTHSVVVASLVKANNELGSPIAS